MNNYLIIDGVENLVPDGYTLKINYVELGKSVQTLSGNYIKDVGLPVLMNFSLKWDIIDSDRMKKVMKLYEDCQIADVVSFKYLYHDNTYHVKTKSTLDNLKMGEIKSTGNLWVYKDFSFDIL